MSRKSLKTRVDERSGQGHAPLFVCLLAVLSILIGGGTTRSNNSSVFVARYRLPAAIDPFAIDDFDGDLAPDVASVQPVSSNSSGTNYIIQLQFGSGKKRSICLTAPWGDVQIVARYVNGDRIPDLIISSAWTEGPYAVLINGGNGTFSTVDPSSVQALHRKSKRRWSWPRPQPSETAATSPPSAERDFAKAKWIGHPRAAKGLVHRPDTASTRCPLLVSLPGHAPPTPALLRPNGLSQNWAHEHFIRRDRASQAESPFSNQV